MTVWSHHNFQLTKKTLKGMGEEKNLCKRKIVLQLWAKRSIRIFSYLSVYPSVLSFLFACLSVRLSVCHVNEWMGHCWDVLMKLLHGSNWSDPSSGEKTMRLCLLDHFYSQSFFQTSKSSSVLKNLPSPT